MTGDSIPYPWQGARGDGRRVRGVSAELIQRAQEMRREPTGAEAALWQALRGRQLSGTRWRFQHPIETYVLDFYCPAAKLIVEVDGAVHNEAAVAERDEARQSLLEHLGYRVLRFSNDAVLHHLPDVLNQIRQVLAEGPGKAPLPP